MVWTRGESEGNQSKHHLARVKLRWKDDKEGQQDSDWAM